MSRDVFENFALKYLRQGSQMNASNDIRHKQIVGKKSFFEKSHQTCVSKTYCDGAFEKKNWMNRSIKMKTLHTHKNNLFFNYIVCLVFHKRLPSSYEHFDVIYVENFVLFLDEVCDVVFDWGFFLSFKLFCRNCNKLKKARSREYSDCWRVKVGFATWCFSLSWWKITPFWSVKICHFY